MNTLLVAINAKYVHSNLAVYTLKEYARKVGHDVEVAEYTINNYVEDILADIYKKKPKYIGFSCYIWNITYVEELARELKKVLPNTHIWYGGPEVSYNSVDYLKEHSYVDGIMIGEGEETLCELLDYYSNKCDDGLKDINGRIEKEIGAVEENEKSLRDIEGIVTRAGEEIIVTKPRGYIDMDSIPFVYNNLSEFENKIIYYESSRGCPYSCSYCMSSIDKRVRFRSMELVYEELKFFLDNKVSQVKFVDRTFNCNHERTKAIWKFIKENDNGITNFHFEVSADILNEEEIALIDGMRPRLIQLEIGVQSTNEETIAAIKRNMDFEKLSQIVKKINDTKVVHQHLDLIAGLPYEDMESFKRSFNDVYRLEPEQLQLGFLKVLKGSLMYEEAEKYGIVYKTGPVYEVLKTNWLSYDEVLKLKQVEDIVEVYYNSRQFENTMKYLGSKFETPYMMYEYIADYYDSQGLFDIKHNRIARYNILIDICRLLIKEEKDIDEEVLLDILKHDLYLREKIKTRPEWASLDDDLKKRYNEFYKDEEIIRGILPRYSEYDTKQIARLTAIERYGIDILGYMKTGDIVYEESFVLYDYMNRSAINYQANVQNVDVK